MCIVESYIFAGIKICSLSINTFLWTSTFLEFFLSRTVQRILIYISVDILTHCLSREINCEIYENLEFHET